MALTTLNVWLVGTPTRAVEKPGTWNSRAVENKKADSFVGLHYFV